MRIYENEQNNIIEDKEVQETSFLNENNESPFANLATNTNTLNKEQSIASDTSYYAEQNLFSIPNYDTESKRLLKNAKDNDFNLIQTNNFFTEEQKKDYFQAINNQYGFIEGALNRLKLEQFLEAKHRKRVLATSPLLFFYYLIKGLSTAFGGMVEFIKGNILDPIFKGESELAENKRRKEMFLNSETSNGFLNKAEPDYNPFLEWGLGNTLRENTDPNDHSYFSKFKQALIKLEDENQWSGFNIMRNVANSIGEMTPLIASTFLSGGLGASPSLANGIGLGVNGLSIFGRSKYEAEKAGLDKESTLKYALTKAGSETLIESIGGIGGLLPTGKIASKLGGKAVAKLSATASSKPVLKQLSKIGLGAMGEAFEEFLGGFMPELDYFKDKEQGKNRSFIQNPFTEDTLYSMFIAGIVGGAGSIVSNHAQYKNDNIKTQTETSNDLYKEFISNSKQYGVNIASDLILNKLKYKTYLLNNNKAFYFADYNLDNGTVKFNKHRANINNEQSVKKLIDMQGLTGVLEYDKQTHKVAISNDYIDMLHNKFTNKVNNKSIVNNDYALSYFTYNKNLNSDIVKKSDLTAEQRILYDSIKRVHYPLALTTGENRTSGGVVYVNVNESKASINKVLAHEIAHNLFTNNNELLNATNNLIDRIDANYKDTPLTINLNKIKQHYANNPSLAIQEQGAYLFENILNRKIVNNILKDTNIAPDMDTILKGIDTFISNTSNIKDINHIKTDIKKLVKRYNAEFLKAISNDVFIKQSSNATYYYDKVNSKVFDDNLKNYKIKKEHLNTIDNKTTFTNDGFNKFLKRLKTFDNATLESLTSDEFTLNTDIYLTDEQKLALDNAIKDVIKTKIEENKKTPVEPLDVKDDNYIKLVKESQNKPSSDVLKPKNSKVKLNNDTLRFSYFLGAITKKISTLLKNIKLKNNLQKSFYTSLLKYKVDITHSNFNKALTELYNSLSNLSDVINNQQDIFNYGLNVGLINEYLDNVKAFLKDKNFSDKKQIQNFYKSLYGIYKELLFQSYTTLKPNTLTLDYNLKAKDAINSIPSNIKVKENALYGLLSTPQDVLNMYAKIIPSNEFNIFNDFKNLYFKSNNDSITYKKELYSIKDKFSKLPYWKDINNKINDKKTYYKLNDLVSDNPRFVGLRYNELLTLKLLVDRNQEEGTNHFQSKTFNLKTKKHTIKVNIKSWQGFVNELNKILSDDISKKALAYINSNFEVSYNNVNTVFKQLHGFDMEKSNTYIPFHLNLEDDFIDFKNVITNIQQKNNVGFINTGFTLPITKNNVPLTIMNINNVLSLHHNNVSNYISYERLLVEYAKQFYLKENKTSIRSILENKKIQFNNYMEKILFPSLIKRVNYSHDYFLNKGVKVINNLIYSSAFSTLAFNPATILKQNLSIFTIAIRNNIPLYKPSLLATFIKGKTQSYFKKGSYNLLFEKSNQFWSRINNFSTSEVFNYIHNFFDSKLNKVKNKIIEVGTYLISKEDIAIIQGFYDVLVKHAKNKFNLNDTDATNYALDRIENIMTNSIASTENMFKTPFKSSYNPFYNLFSLMQGENQMQFSGILTSIREVKNGIPNSKAKLVSYLTAFIISATFEALISTLFSSIRGRQDGLDKKDRALDFFLNKWLLNAILGIIPLFNTLSNSLEFSKGALNLSLNSSSYDILNPSKKVIQSLISFSKSIKNGKWQGQYALNLVKSVSYFLGIPLANLVRIVESSNNLLSKSGKENFIKLNNWFKKRTNTKALKIALINGDNKIIEHYIKSKDATVLKTLISLNAEYPNFKLDPSNLNDDVVNNLARLFKSDIFQNSTIDDKVKFTYKIINKYKSLDKK